MNIAIDFDDTISLAPDDWGTVIALFKEKGHGCWIVTNNWFSQRPDIQEYGDTYGVPVVFVGSGYKSQQMKSRGIWIDVWIDDYPAGI